MTILNIARVTHARGLNDMDRAILARRPHRQSDRDCRARKNQTADPGKTVFYRTQLIETAFVASTHTRSPDRG